ncbi:hypothetical protein PG997_001137 [Apiospora hydei]|uniref:Uncharacterized protein n=1 Tax=Apiospora hydei TaxID=1337664 RepID=A0ABR1XCN9_9PEZI
MLLLLGTCHRNLAAPGDGSPDADAAEKHVKGQRQGDQAGSGALVLPAGVSAALVVGVVAAAVVAPSVSAAPTAVGVAPSLVVAPAAPPVLADPVVPIAGGAASPVPRARTSDTIGDTAIIARPGAVAAGAASAGAGDRRRRYTVGRTARELTTQTTLTCLLSGPVHQFLSLVLRSLLPVLHDLVDLTGLRRSARDGGDGGHGGLGRGRARSSRCCSLSATVLPLNTESLAAAGSAQGGGVLGVFILLFVVSLVVDVSEPLLTTTARAGGRGERGRRRDWLVPARSREGGSRSAGGNGSTRGNRDGGGNNNNSRRAGREAATASGDGGGGRDGSRDTGDILLS